jgi:C1A family cysteine protease
MQYLVDLSQPSNGFEGITSANWYPYFGTDEQCEYDEGLPSYQLFTYMQLSNDQSIIKKVVGLEGPVSAGVFFNPMVHYTSGVFNDPNDECKSNKADFALTIVGYGTDATTNEEYWLCKNYLGTNWGENGYIRILRQETGKGICQISRFCIYPLVM